MTHLNEHHPDPPASAQATRRQLLEEVDRPALTSLPAEPYRVLRMAEMPRRHRLSRRGRRPLLQCAPSLRPRRGRRAADGAGPSRFSSRASGSPHMCAPAATISTPPSPSAHAVQPIGATPAGRSTYPRRRAPDRGGDGGPCANWILEARPHPEQGFRACLGIDPARGSPWRRAPTKPAAERAIDIGARTFRSVKSILDNNLDRRPARQRSTDGTPILHANIRGAATTIRRNDLLETSTLDQLSALGLHGMAKAFAEIAANEEASGLGHHEWLGLLLGSRGVLATGQGQGAAARRQTAPTGQRRRYRLS